VNKRIVPLKYRLNTGEIVEILTASEARPSRDWLNIVKTSRARSPIRRWLNQRQKEEAVELGRKLLEKEFRKHKLPTKKYESRLEPVLGHFGVSRVDELIASVGFGRISARLVVNRIEPRLEGAATEDKSESKLGSAVRKMLRRSDSPIQVKGHSDLLVFRARCCNPIKGEDVVGYITVGKGISVHSTNCPNLENLLLNSERKVDVSWTPDGDETRYPVRLAIHTEDRKGILADITGAVSGINANIVDARARLIDGNYGLVEMTVEVTDTEHLEKIVTYIKKVGGVRDVDRGKQSSRR
jgi:GTP pyrophosphokinase